MAFLAKNKVISINDLIVLVKGYSPSSETDVIRNAFEFSSKAHKGQKRESGEPFLGHLMHFF